MSRHRPLRATAGRWPGSTVGRTQVQLLADVTARRLRRARRLEGSTPFEVQVVSLPPTEPPKELPSDVRGSAVLADHRITPDGRVVVTLYAWPIQLWTDEPLEQQVHDVVTEQLADALGLDPDDL